MPLTKCKECGKAISSTAEKCPCCGARVGSVLNNIKDTLRVIAAGFLLYGLYLLFFETGLFY